MVQAKKKSSIKIERASDERELIRSIAARCGSVGEVTATLKSLFGGVIEQMMQAELDEHLGYDKHSATGNNSGNSRNGFGVKTIASQWGECEIDVPRDRAGTFKPKVLPNGVRRTDDIEQRIIAMYAKGVSTRDIEDYVRDIYGADVSPALVSRITDKILPELTEWQNRPLEAIYPVMFLDGIVFKVKHEGRIINKCVYTVMAYTMAGHKDILGIWITENESARYWTTVLTELKNRGVKDILVMCRDNLTGINGAITTVFPHTEQQLCIVHQIRNSCKYVSYKDLKAVTGDLKKLYTAISLEQAEEYREEFREKWSKKYPYILKGWDANWAELMAFYKFPQEVRIIIYTTNAVEGFHRMLRKFTKTKTVYPSDDSLKKSVYLSVKEISKKWSTMRHNWNAILNQLLVYYGDRIDLACG